MFRNLFFLTLGTKPVTVLVVDDSEISRYHLVHVLRGAGHRILIGQNAEEALDLAQTSPDLILLDVQLPDMNGFEVCRKLKAAAVTAGIPVLLISALFFRGEDHLYRIDSGADDFIPLPVDPCTLIRTVKTWDKSAHND